MRLKSLLAAAAAIASTALAAAQPAKAGDLLHGRDRGYAGPDPYAYRYVPRGYYPYYNSDYWVPAHVMRERYRTSYKLPKYYKAWGYPKSSYNHGEWHAEHHGRHHRWHW